MMASSVFTSSDALALLWEKLSVDSAEISLDVIRTYMHEITRATADLDDEQRFSTPELEKYFRERLPATAQPITKTKLNYLRSQGLLHPEVIGEGGQRTSWRYTPEDLRRTLLVELLKAGPQLSVQEIKGWLRSYAEAQRTESLSTESASALRQEKASPPSPVVSAYTRLRNRVLGALITALGKGKADVPPRDSLIGLRIVQPMEQTLLPRRLASWEEVHQLLGVGAWHFATSDSYPKLYVYSSIERLVANQPEVSRAFQTHDYFWYTVLLRDQQLSYQLVLGVPEGETHQPLVQPIIANLESYVEAASYFDLTQFPGLSTLLRAALVYQPQIEVGTALSALAEIIATASDAWEYCAILLPEVADDGSERSLYIHEHSANFPAALIDKQVEIGRFLSGWCYANNQVLLVEPTVEGDPRIAAYEYERPVAAVAAPAVVLRNDSKEHVVGVLYLARREPAAEQGPLFTDELVAAVKEFGYVCGDLLGSYLDEVGTVRGIARLSTRSVYPYRRYDDLPSLITALTENIKTGVGLQDAPHSWVYLLTLNIWVPPQMDTRLARWVYGQSAHLTGEFLAHQLWDAPVKPPVEVGVVQTSLSQYVFAILQVVELGEKAYKRRLIELTEKLELIQIPRLATKFYAWGVTFPYDTLRKQLHDKRSEGLVADLIKITQGALVAGPFVSRGHEEMDKGDLDSAITQFRNAKDRARENWYVFKHLAEALMLSGQFDEAMAHCRKAIELNPNYASAICLLADCLSYQGNYVEAVQFFERAISLNSSRADFLLHYSAALSGMTRAEYSEAVARLRSFEPAYARYAFPEEPHMHALDKIEEAQKLSEVNHGSQREARQHRARYYYHRGYVYLQAGLLDEALTELSIGRKLTPDDEKLVRSHAYALNLKYRR